MHSTRRTAVIRGIAMTALVALAQVSHAVSITYVGTEPGTAGSGYATQSWSVPTVSKLYATGTSNTYGKDGYWQIRPIATPAGASSVSEGVAGGNNLGTSAGTFPTLWSGSLPSFVGGINGFAGSFVNFDGYSFYFGPNGSTLYRQGALSVSVPLQTPAGNTPSGANTGNYGETLSFTLNYSGTVRVGFAVDSVGTGKYAPDYVSIFSGTTGTVFSSLLTRDGSPDMAVFDIANPSGQTFTVAQWQLLTGPNEYNVSAMSLVTFDLIAAVPEPSTIGLLAAGGVALMVPVLRRRRS